MSNKIKTTHLIKEIGENLDSRLMTEPIINKYNFTESLRKSNTNMNIKNDLFDLKLIDYNMLKELIEKCGSFPKSQRNYLWKFLLSLPNNKNMYNNLKSKGIHPFYRNLNLKIDTGDLNLNSRLKKFCSIISYWSPNIGNVYFLPDIIFPFLKIFNEDDIFTFELLIIIFNTYCQYWFEFYPGAPMNHILIAERMIIKECKELVLHLKKLEEECNDVNFRLNEIIWRIMKSFFSDTFHKEVWIQFLDFIFIYSHKPEILLYFLSAYIISESKVIIKSKDYKSLESVMFNEKKNVNILKIITLTLKLYEKYSKYQLYGYIPYNPDKIFTNNEKFPKQFLETTAKLKEELFFEENNFKQKENEILEAEKNMKNLIRTEEKMQREYLGLIHREKEKSNIYKQELDMILYHKEKYYEDLKKRHLEKVQKLQKVINNSLKYYDEMKKTELLSVEDDVMVKKIKEEINLRNKMFDDKIIELENETNKKLINLIKLRHINDYQLKVKEDEILRTKEREFNNELLEKKWKLEDELAYKKTDNLRNLQEIEINRLNNHNQTYHKDFNNNLLNLENDILLLQVDRERRARMIENEQIEKKNKILNNKSEALSKLDLENTMKYDDKSNEIINILKQSLKTIEKDEIGIIENDHQIRKKEFDLRANELLNQRNKIDPDHKYLQDLENYKQMNKKKREELEFKKKQIMNSLDNLINISINENTVSSNSKRLNDMYSSEEKKSLIEKQIREENEKLIENIKNDNNKNDIRSPGETMFKDNHKYNIFHNNYEKTFNNKESESDFTASFKKDDNNFKYNKNPYIKYNETYSPDVSNNENTLKSSSLDYPYQKEYNDESELFSSMSNRYKPSDIQYTNSYNTNSLSLSESK